MTREIKLTNDDFESAVIIIHKMKDNCRLFIKLNRKTYGGLVTLEGTFEQIKYLCSILEENGIMIE